MISRNLRIALLISLGVHILVMSAVTIVTPDGIKRVRPYTCVDFLGPILRKTAFDIMLENAAPVMKTTYGYTFLSPKNEYLNVVAPKRELTVQMFSAYQENSMDALIVDFLTGSKAMPDFALDFMTNDFVPEGKRVDSTAESEQRKVIYRPDPPVVMRALYGDKEPFRIRVRVLIDGDGNVKKVEPLTTTGDPRLDIIAFKFVKSWIFEPRKDTGGTDEWLELNVVLNTGE